MKYWYILLLLVLLPVASANYSNSLLSYWSFDNGTVTNLNATSSGVTATGYWRGTVPANATCILRQCVYFTASPSFLNISRALMQDASDNTYTMGAWVYPTSTSSMVVAGTQSGGSNGVNWFYDTTPKTFMNKAGVLNLDYAYTYVNKWTFLVFVQNSSGMYWFANGTQVASNANTASFALSSSNSAGIGRRVIDLTSDQQFTGYVDDIFFYGRALNGTEITQLYNSGSGYNPFYDNTTTEGFNNITSAIYGSDRLTTFELLFEGQYAPSFINTTTTTNTSTGFNAGMTASVNGSSLNFSDVTSLTSGLTLTPSYAFTSVSFIYNRSSTATNVNISFLVNGTYYADLSSSPTNTEVNYTYRLNGTGVNFTFSCTDVSVVEVCSGYVRDINVNLPYATTNGTIFIPGASSGVRNFTLYVYSNISHFNVSYTNYNLSNNLTFPYTVLKLNGTDYVTGYPVVNYSVALNSTSNSYPSSQIAVNQSVTYFTDNNLTLFLHYAKAGYISNFTTPTGLLDGIYNYTLYFYPNNSVLFSIYNATNLVPTNGILVDVALVGSGNNTYFSSTSNGSLFFEGLLPDTYTIDAQAPGFGAFTGSLIVGANTFQTYAIYMPPLESTNTVFSIQDFSGGNPIPGAIMVTEYKPTLNSSFINIGAYTSDVTGSILLYYTPGAHYRFTLSASGYQTRQFELDPIIFSTYDITLTRNVTTNVTDDFDSITITIAPSIVYNARTTNFTFYVATPLGNLQGFNYSIWSDVNTTRLSGLTTNAYGDTLVAPYYVNASARGEKVYIEYTYYLTSGTVKTYLRVYPIVDYNAYTFTQVSEFGNYGLPLFDRMFIVMVVLIFGAGFAFAFGGEVVAGFIAILILVYFSFIGFIPLWFSAISTLILLWFIWSRT